MWTPRRIVMLAGAFVAFTLVYLVYAMTSLGRINTLPPLPEKYAESTQGSEGVPVLEPGQRGPSPLERKLEMAFRPGCPELKWPVRLELNSRSMVMAAEDFKTEKDGRVLLEHLSVAMFGKKKNDGKDLEITTLRCKRAYITFDRPVSSFSPNELNGRKVVAAEFLGEGQTPILIENNRRTAAHDDDLTVRIDTGPLHYSEKRQFIWTNDVIHLRDGWTEPPRANVVAKGMEMDLATSAPPPKPGAPIASKPKTESISGVKRIVLKSDVSMHLYAAGGGPLPGGDKAQPAAGAKTAAQPSHIIIRTEGRFQYDLFKDHDLARFDVPDQELSGSPQDVTVMRINPKGGNDQLVCKHLELRVKRRSNDTPSPGTTPAAQSAEQGLEVETAHATGPDVILTSDQEKLDAHGNDFFHDATQKLTILKGTPHMEANKEDSLIQAPELRIQDVPLPVAAGQPAKSHQQVEATGPGEIHMINKATGQQTTHAFWKKGLISTRKEGMDVLVLTGEARFQDTEHKQSLKAEVLEVWLLSEEEKPAASPKPAAAKADQTKTAASPQQSRRPHHIVALRNVVAQSRELNIHDTSRLVVRFTDVPAERMPPPRAGQKAEARSPASGAASAPGVPATSAPPPQVPASGAASAPQAGENSGRLRDPARPQAAPEPDRPIDLTARTIEADVLRCAERMALDHLWADGSSLDSKGGVEVRQAPAKPGERGVYIKGNTLKMSATPEGNILDVTGDLAQLEMDKIIIIGPEVNIDQAKNQASVTGQGAMQMQSDQTLEGRPLGRTVPLRIHWSKEMFFSGESAVFLGNIQAEQENARLACRTLQVSFDRPISLKAGPRGDQPAKVRSLVADYEVRVEDTTLDQRTKRLEKYQRMEGISLTMTTVPRDDEPPQAGKSKDANEVTVSGPGNVRLMQRGGSDFNATPGQPPPNRVATSNKTTEDQVMKMTYIRYDQLMKASNRTNVANFWGSVRVLNFPCDDPHREIDLEAMIEELPEGGMYMRCDRLKALTEQKKGKTYQRMEAEGQVIVRAKDFFAQADKMRFNEEKDQVILYGDKDRPAVLERQRAQGERPTALRAKKIIYYRKTGAASVPEGDSIDG